MPYCQFEVEAVRETVAGAVGVGVAKEEVKIQRMGLVEIVVCQFEHTLLLHFSSKEIEGTDPFPLGV